MKDIESENGSPSVAKIDGIENNEPSASFLDLAYEKVSFQMLGSLNELIDQVAMTVCFPPTRHDAAQYASGSRLTDAEVAQIKCTTVVRSWRPAL